MSGIQRIIGVCRQKRDVLTFLRALHNRYIDYYEVLGVNRYADIKNEEFNEIVGIKNQVDGKLTAPQRSQYFVQLKSFRTVGLIISGGRAYTALP